MTIELKDHKFHTWPYEHQRVCFNTSGKLKEYALLADLGTGKTKMVIDTAVYMYKNGWINALLVLGNNGSYLNWVEAFEEHCNKDIKITLGIWSSKNTPKKKAKLTTDLFLKKDPGLTILLMNIEAMAFKQSSLFAYNFAKAHKTFTAIDESTTISNPKAARTKSVLKLRSVSIVRRILTGSVIDDGPLKAWSQYEFLRRGALGFTSFIAFRSFFAVTHDLIINRSGKLVTINEVVGYKNLDILRKRIAKMSFIVKKEDCLDLPGQSFTTRTMPLSSELRVHYNNLVDQSMAQITESLDSVVTVKLALSLMLRLQQICNGHIKDDEGNMHYLKSVKIPVLKAMLRETSSKVLIWTKFTHDIHAIAELLTAEYGADSFLTYYGETSVKERAKARQVFKRGGEDANIRFLIANDKTGGYGNNFTAITTVIYYSYDFGYNLHHQTIDRVYRIGQIEAVSYYYLQVLNSIEEKIKKALDDKRSISELVTPSNWRDFFGRL